MDLSPRSWERLKKLKDLSEASSYADVMKEALKLYEFLLIQEENGTEFFLKKKEADTIPLKLFISA